MSKLASLECPEVDCGKRWKEACAGRVGKMSIGPGQGGNIQIFRLAITCTYVIFEHFSQLVSAALVFRQ